MQTAQVIGKFQEGLCSYELYSDGDCVLRKGNEGFIQISASMLRKLTLVQSSKAPSSVAFEPPPVAPRYVPPQAQAQVATESDDQSDDEPEEKETPKVLATPDADDHEPEHEHEPVAAAVAPRPVQSKPKVAESKAAASPDEMPKAAEEFTRKLTSLGGPNGWECIFKIGNRTVAQHVYSTRSFGRTGKPSDEVGQNGRIS